jgi:2-oxoglutarate dehydrogenase E2 component (dihydrolipoamide succinyltransferase)
VLAEESAHARADHRIVDGAEAVRFLVRVKELVEDPGVLLIES